VRYLPLTALSFFVAYGAGQLTVRIQSRILLGSGTFLVAVGLYLMSFTHADSTWSVLLPGFIICGIGIGMVNPVLASASISVVPPQESGMASGTNNTFRQMGIATGIAVYGAIFQSQVVSKTTAVLQQTATGRSVLQFGGANLKAALAGGGVRAVAASPQVPGPAKPVLIHAYQIGFSGALNHLMIVATIVALVGAVAGAALVRQKDFIVPGGGEPQPAVAHAA
jgi:hypothetical protein